MQRNFLRGLLICLVPCLLAALFAAPVSMVQKPDGSGRELKFGLDRYRLGIDLAGGTILVYEVNLERTRLRKATEQGGKEAKEARDAAAKAGEVDQSELPGLTSEEMNQLAAQIKRRIDPTDIKNVTVRPSGDRRIEIILPITGASGDRSNLSQEEIAEVKRLVSQMGVLEFRIIANGPDDERGMLAAQQVIRSATPAELQARATRGLPPPAPDDTFPVNINDTQAMVRYAWAELAPEYRIDMGLNNDPANRAPGTLWSYLAANRNKAVPLRGRTPINDVQSADMLLYSREAASADTLAKEAETYARLKAEQPRSGLTDAEIEAQVNRKLVEYFVLTRVSPVDSLRVGEGVTLTARAGTDSKTNSPAIDFTFNSEGGRKFGQITRRNKPDRGHSRLLAVVLDEKLVSAATIQSEITTQGQITGKFDRKKVERDVQILRSGALTAELREKPVSENTIGPTLGADTIRKGTRAIGMAFLVVLAFMVIYYRFAGLVACIALFANLLLTVGFMVAVNAAFTLPGLAGLVLTLGMAVDANVLIYERLREERNKGANLATAIRNGYDRAFLTIIDTHLTSIFTAIVLYTFGNDQLKGFAIALAVGLIISLFTSLYMTRLMFDYWLHRRWLTELRMMRFFARPNLNPMKYRWFFFPITAALTIAGLVVFYMRDEGVLNVDFRGGTVFAGRLMPGEERALTTTPDGKPGFRELLTDPARQDERLAVEKVYWVNRPTSEEANLNTWVFTITYKGGGTSTVTFTSKPQGATPEEMIANVAERASRLPDVSVEQTFLSNESYEMGKSRRFTIRTTEREPELVRTALDRLLRDKEGNTLLDTATMSFPQQEIEVERDGQKVKRSVPVLEPDGKIKLTFDKPTSRSFVLELLEREFRKLGEEVGKNTLTLTAEGQATDNRVQEMRLSVANVPSLSALKPDAKATPQEKAQQLVALGQVLDSVKRSFDATPEPERLEVFDSQLAKETRQKALIAIGISWIAIILYLWFRFGNWTFGLAAVICLIHDLCFTLGVIAACHYLHLIPGFTYLGIEDFKIDLAAVAALLTLVGYSVNEIIVNFARVREVRGKNPKLTPQMVNDSVNQTLSRTILTAGTTFLVSLVLYSLGGEGVHLFAFVMLVGVAIATYSSIFVACPLLLFLGEGRDTTAPTDEPATTDKEEAGTEEEVVEG
jgi:SecD/SecF fusion protein